MNPQEQPDISARLAVIEQKIDAMTKVVNRLRLYFLMTVIISVFTVLLPAIGLIWAIPQFINSYVTPLQTLSSNQ